MAKFRLYVPLDERRENPEPADTRDVIPVGIGLLVWLIALIVGLIVFNPGRGGDDTFFWTSLFGLGGGIVLLVFAVLHERRRGQ